MTSRHETVHRLFIEAVKLPRDARAAFLDEQCNGDLEVRGEVEAMLAADAQTGGDFDAWLFEGEL